MSSDAKTLANLKLRSLMVLPYFGAILVNVF